MKYEMQMSSISNLHVPELRKTKTGFIGVNNMNLSSHTKSLYRLSSKLFWNPRICSIPPELNFTLTSYAVQTDADFIWTTKEIFADRFPWNVSEHAPESHYINTPRASFSGRD